MKLIHGMQKPGDVPQDAVASLECLATALEKISSRIRPVQPDDEPFHSGFPSIKLEWLYANAWIDRTIDELHVTAGHAAEELEKKLSAPLERMRRLGAGHRLINGIKIAMDLERVERDEPGPITIEYWSIMDDLADAARFMRNVAATLRRESGENECGRADASADASEKNRQHLPDNVDARDLAHELERQLPRGEKSRKQIAREFTRGDEQKADSLLRIIRKYPLLHNAVKEAAARARK